MMQNVIVEGASRRPFAIKQMGDATEMLVAAKMTLAGVPAMKVPDLWPGYDVIAQPVDATPQRISVKARTHKKANYIVYDCRDQFDWLAVVLLMPETGERRVYIIPRADADAKARRDKETSKTAADRYFTAEEIERHFGHYRDNFVLDQSSRSGSEVTVDCWKPTRVALD